MTYPDSSHAGQRPPSDLYELSALLTRFPIRETPIFSCLLSALLPTSTLRNKNSRLPKPLSSIQAKTVDVPSLTTWNDRVFLKIQTRVLFVSWHFLCDGVYTELYSVEMSQATWKGKEPGTLSSQLPQGSSALTWLGPLFMGIPFHLKGSTTRKSGRSAAQERLRQT